MYGYDTQRCLNHPEDGESKQSLRRDAKSFGKLVFDPTVRWPDSGQHDGSNVTGLICKDSAINCVQVEKLTGQNT